mgnify:CR=1 FL=1
MGRPTWRDKWKRRKKKKNVQPSDDQVFETGVLLPEITKMTQDAISSNPDAAF